MKNPDIVIHNHIPHIPGESRGRQFTVDVPHPLEGYEPNGGEEPCPRCGGTGMVTAGEGEDEGERRFQRELHEEGALEKGRTMDRPQPIRSLADLNQLHHARYQRPWNAKAPNAK